MLERDKTVEALRESNKEMKSIIAQMRIPKIDVLTLVNPTNLKFFDLICKMVIVPYLKIWKI